MALSVDLIKQFATITNDKTDEKKNNDIYGTVVIRDNKLMVLLDGAPSPTPVATTFEVKADERVIVRVENHKATIIGNISAPAARGEDVKKVITTVDAISGKIGTLESDNVTINEKLTAASASIEELTAKDVEITGNLTATNAAIENLKVTKLDAEQADIKFATIENLKATNADIYNLTVTHGKFENATAENFTATNARIEKLDVEKLSATDAEIKYANIDFANIGKAAFETFFSKSGLIEDVVIGEGHVTGNLVGVTIIGDLIKGGTVQADKLVIKGTDGLYYKLNTDGVKIEAQQTDQNSLNGSIITAKSITATKVNVDDLVAFDATIAGFNITEGTLYSGVKESVDNTTRGVYLDKDGQVNFGDGSNYIKYYRQADGTYKLDISAASIRLSSSGSTVEDAFQEIKDEMNTIKDEVTTLLRLESSRGTVFKNDNISTVLSVVIYRGNHRVTDMPTLKTLVGPGATLQWSWQRLNDESFGIISADDHRLGAEGFTFTLSPEDVDTKVTFMCELKA